MKNKLIVLALASCLLSASLVFAQWVEKPTHFGKAELTLSLIDAKGKTQKIASESSYLALHWKQKICSISFKDGGNYKNVDCLFSNDRDLIATNGELIMKAMPQINFEGNVVADLIRTLGKHDKKLSHSVDRAVENSESVLAKGLAIPFYTCGDCRTAGDNLLLWDVYKSYSEKTVELTSGLGGSKLILSVKVKGMKVAFGNINIVSDNSQGI